MLTRYAKWTMSRPSYAKEKLINICTSGGNKKHHITSVHNITDFRYHDISP